MEAKEATRSDQREAAIDRRNAAAKHEEELKKCIAELRDIQDKMKVLGAELHNKLKLVEAPLSDDEALFKEPPPREECPICLLTLPFHARERRYRVCCGKVICAGCSHAIVEAEGCRDLCAFCRSAKITTEECMKRIEKRAESNHADAIYLLGSYYNNGDMGLRQDHDKARKLWLRAGKLGEARGYHGIGQAYLNGEGVERDMKKAQYYWELAAVGGNVEARHNLGALERNEGNAERAVKHWMISAAAGHDDSLKTIRESYLAGHATKDDFEKALRAHKDAKDEMVSEQRSVAAAARG
mgnify:CR=1 FL=1